MPVLITQKDIDKLFERFIKIYAYEFVNRYGSFDTGTWMEKLKNLTPEQIDFGISEVEKEGTIYHTKPPSPIAFRDICLKSNKDRTYLGNQFVKFIYKPANPEIAKKYMMEIRKSLGMRQNVEA